MSNFRTSISLQESSFLLSHQDNILCLGSCFAQNMAQKLQALKFSILANPFGISYHPISICKSLDLLLSQEHYRLEDLFLHQGLWHSFDHHGSFSGVNAQETLQQINIKLAQARIFLKKTNRIILTLGTAYVFEHIETNRIVANCHKLAGAKFQRKRLSIEFIQQNLADSLERLKKQNPAIEVILSLSPIRHIRDGLIENQRSKASLVLAIAQLEQSFDFVHYFPAYEIQLDDLRDYRFYAADMIHPSITAIDYIWQHFSRKYFTTDTINLNKEIKTILQAVHHRILHPKTEKHQVFIQQQLKKMEGLEAKFNFLNFSKEAQMLQ